MAKSAKQEIAESGFIMKLIYMVFFIFILAFYIIKLIVEGIINLCKYIKNKNKEKEKQRTWEEKYNKRYFNSLTYTIVTPYDDLFLKQISDRGKDYYLNNKINNYKYDNNTCSCSITGTNKYDVKIQFYKNNKIKKATCTCPYHLKDNSYCKHIYALLINFCIDNRVEGFIKEKNNLTKSNSTIVYKKNELIKTMELGIKEVINSYHIIDIDNKRLSDIYSKIIDYIKVNNDIKNKNDLDITKEDYLFLKRNEKKLHKLCNKYVKEAGYLVTKVSQKERNRISKELENSFTEEEKLKYNKSNENREFRDALFEFFDAITTSSHKPRSRYTFNGSITSSSKNQSGSKYTKDELLHTWGLSEEEANIVLESHDEFEPWNFEEPGLGDELTEEDYYYDDPD